MREPISACDTSRIAVSIGDGCNSNGRHRGGFEFESFRISRDRQGPKGTYRAGGTVTSVSLSVGRDVNAVVRSWYTRVSRIRRIKCFCARDLPGCPFGKF